MYTKRKLHLELYVLAVIGVAGLFTPVLSFAQYDYYDPYSNSNIDYYPMNPVYTAPSNTTVSGTTGGTSGATSGTVSSGGTTVTTTTTTCANKPLVNPQNTRSVEIRDKGGKVFYLSPPKEELVGMRAYPETSTKIFKIVYGSTGMQIDEKEIGLITVSNNCYPKYGYIWNDSLVNTKTIATETVPENTIAVNLDPITGEVFDAKTGLPINYARYHAKTRNIYYRNTYLIFGTVLTDTTGYVNIDNRGTVDTTVAPAASVVTTAPIVESTVVPIDKTAAKLDPATGKVYNAKTGVLIPDARYDVALRKIFYKDTESTFGKVFTETTGYVNIDPIVKTTYVAPLTPSPKITQYNESDIDFIKGSNSQPIGDPDFDLLKLAPTHPYSGDVDRAGALPVVGKTAPPSSGFTGSDSGVGELSDKMIGDPDFDLLNIDIGGDDLEKFRADVSDADQAKKVTVRGWDSEKKKEIIGRPEEVKTSEDLKMYVEAVALNDSALNGITIKQGVLEVESREEGKLFWFIPVTMSAHVVVDFTLKDSTSDPVDVKFPWWHIFVKKDYHPSALEKELLADTTGAFDPSKWEKVDNSEAPTNASRAARALQMVSNILKTKHDTVKNSISNVR